MDTLILTTSEVESNHNRQQWAENLILQLPHNHDGRNSWLLNYGIKAEAVALRAKRGVEFNHFYQAVTL